MENKIKLILEDGNILKVDIGTKAKDVLKEINDKNVIGIRINGKAVPSNYEISNDALVQNITISSRIGRKIYIKGLEFVYLLAVQELYGDYTKVSIKHSLDKAIYTELNLAKGIDGNDVAAIKKQMKKIIDKDYEINKISASREDIIEYVNKLGEYEKALNYKYMTSDIVSIYELKDLYNYFYYIMPASTGIVKKFNLTYIPPKGIVLSYPINGELPKYKSTEKVLSAFQNYQNKLSKLNVNYGSDINKLVIENKIKDFIQIDEMIYRQGIEDIANQIASSKKIKVIFMSGPSSSGKTTSSKRLSLSLKAKGINTVVLSTDDYYVDREESPKDENGEYDFEVVEAIDYKLFGKDLNKLLKGEEVTIPTYNFLTGKREYKNSPIKLNKNEVIIVEGLHAINSKISGSVDNKNKLNIYLSPFVPISIDRHNHISTTDLRLLRRIVRDFNTRGYSGEQTLTRWQKMRKSEEKNIYPYQREADIILNTSLSYEIGVLKTYAEPLLYSIESDSENYEEAVRILNFLKGFLNIPSEYVPNTSILREFIGNSYFE